MKNLFLAVAFAAATLTGCAHHKTVIQQDNKVVKDAKVVKAPAKIKK